jgi:hypothetical protein
LRKTDSMRLERGKAAYFLAADRADVRVREDLLRLPDLRARPANAVVFRPFGVLMILRTATTRSEVRPRISPIFSGVGTGLPMTCAPMAHSKSGRPAARVDVHDNVDAVIDPPDVGAWPTRWLASPGQCWPKAKPVGLRCRRSRRRHWPAIDAWLRCQARKSPSRFSQSQSSGGDFYRVFCQVCWRKRDGKMVEPGALERCLPEKPVEACKVFGTRAQRIPSGSRASAHTKAGYLCADPSAHLHFSPATGRRTIHFAMPVRTKPPRISSEAHPHLSRRGVSVG